MGEDERRIKEREAFLSKHRVVITDYNFASLDIERSVLESLGIEVSAHQCKTLEQLESEARDADGLLNQYFGPLGEELFKNCPRLRMIVRYGIGVDTIDIPAATRYGIMVSNVPEFCLEEVSDHAAALILNLARKIRVAMDALQKGQYDWKILKPIHRLKDSVVGFIGFGRIARRTAQKLAAFGPRFIYYDPFLPEARVEGAEKVTLEALLTSSDYISIHCPETAETRRLLNEERLALMKPGAFLINTSRGGIVQTDVLVDLLRKGRIAGAALDVVEGVPPLMPDDPLCSMSNVILTPHSAWYSEESLKQVQKDAAEEMGRGITGGSPKYLLNPEVLK